MSPRRDIRDYVAMFLAALLACPPSHALISLNDGRDRIFVTGSVSVSRDSNVFANSDNRGDYVYSTSLSAEYTRRAGWIGVNANVGVSSSRFAEIPGQNFDNPSIGLEFTKQTGRTTGSLTLSAARESRADASVNVRSTSWNIPVGLSFKYPIAGAYTLSGSLGYSSRRYLDEEVFTSLATYSTSVDLLKILSTERELVTGYRYRYSESTRNTASIDHSVSLGLSGKLLRGLRGGLRAGFQTRGTTGRSSDESRFSSWFASGSTSYSLSRKLMANFSIAKDYSTTAIDSMVDNTNGSIGISYALNSRINLSLNGDLGDSRYLGKSGRVVLSPGPPPILGRNRHDNFLSWSASTGYSFSEHLKVGISYNWFQNWSTLPYADFVRSSWSANASSRW